MEGISTYVALGALSLLPLLFMVTTSFVKISVVFSILRNALGTGQVPSGLIIAALSAILTLYVMTPVFETMVERATPALSNVDTESPFQGDSLNAIGDAIAEGKVPLLGFLTDNSNPEERALFLELARENRDPAAVSESDFLVVLPAFLITELTEAFLIGFLIFVPFLVLDLVVSNVLLSLGMHMTSPQSVSLPFKLLLFVVADGWFLLSQALVSGYS